MFTLGASRSVRQPGDAQAADAARRHIDPGRSGRALVSDLPGPATDRPARRRWWSPSRLPSSPILLLVAAIVYDWRTRGRPHPVYVIGGIALMAVKMLNLLVSPTPAWHAFAGGMLALAQ